MKPLAENETPENLVRAFDPPRFFATQFAPAAVRADLYTLYAFDLEIRKIPYIVTHPIAGKTRYQWWFDVLCGKRAEEARASPLARALVELVRKYEIETSVFDTYFTGRLFDLSIIHLEEPFEFEAYAAQTDGTILQLACSILREDKASRFERAIKHLCCASTMMTRVLHPLMGGAGRQILNYVPDAFRTTDSSGSYGAFIPDSRVNLFHMAERVLGETEIYLKKGREKSRSVYPRDEYKPAFLHFALFKPAMERMQRLLDNEIMRPVKFARIYTIFRIWCASGEWPCF